MADEIQLRNCRLQRGHAIDVAGQQPEKCGKPAALPENHAKVYLGQLLFVAVVPVADILVLLRAEGDACDIVAGATSAGEVAHPIPEKGALAAWPWRSPEMRWDFISAPNWRLWEALQASRLDSGRPFARGSMRSPESFSIRLGKLLPKWRRALSVWRLHQATRHGMQQASRPSGPPPPMAGQPWEPASLKG